MSDWKSIIRVALFFTLSTIFATAADRPNILWILVDDMSANFSCYGETAIKTPAVDQLASEGLLFSRAYATSPVCSTFRSALITGMYQTSIGVHHHRSGRGKAHQIKLPEGVRPVPEYFKKAGYWTCIGSGLPGFGSTGTAVTVNRQGKTDYNFNWDKKIYDSHDWAERKQGQPFFMQVQLHGGKIRGASVSKYETTEKRMVEEFGKPTNPESVTLPPYYPRDPILLRDWATYLDNVKLTDKHVGLVMDRLRNEGLLENTLVIFFTDHGISHARGKQFLYDEGTHIPLVIRGPGIEPGNKRDDLVEHIDVAALSLAAAGIKIPKRMEGADILAANYQPNEFIFAARDRCGEAADRVRSVRSDQYLYIKNYYPQRPHLMPSNYKDSKLIIQRLRELHASGKVPELTNELLFSPTRPAEELYRYQNDRWQTVNLASSTEHEAALTRHRNQLSQWISETGDHGPETDEVYQAEVDDQMSATRNKASRENYRKNSEIYKHWAREGK